jgi:hypothetical protein
MANKKCLCELEKARQDKEDAALDIFKWIEKVIARLNLVCFVYPVWRKKKSVFRGQEKEKAEQQIQNLYLLFRAHNLNDEEAKAATWERLKKCLMLNPEYKLDE